MTDQVAEVVVPDDPFDLDVTAVPEQERQVRAVPEGKYQFEVVGYEAATNPNSGNKGITYNLQLIAPLESQEVEGIPVDRIKFDHTMWVTHKSAPVIISIHRKLNPNIQGTIAEFPEQMVGTNVVGVLTTQTVSADGEPLTWPRYRVTDLYSL